MQPVKGFPDVSSQEFLQAISHMSNVVSGKGGKVTLLNSGKEFLSALLDDIEHAEKSINITAYIWEAGDMSDQVAEALGEKAKDGVEVRLLLDGIGSLSNTWAQLSKLQKRGAKVKYFRGIRPDKIMQLHRRSHRRALIIDGKVAFTGGMAFADYWCWGAKPKAKPWRDLMIRVTGEPVSGVQVAFTELWVNTTGELLAGERFYPTKDSSEEQTKEEGRRSYPKDNGENQPFVHLSSSPSSDIHPFSRFIWASAFSAKKCLYITTPYFVPNKSFHNCLKEKARQGVDVRLILPNEAQMDQKIVRWAANTYYWELLEAGVRIFEYQPAMIHTKLLIADDCWSVIGTGNMDYRSFELNEENAFGFQDNVLAKSLLKVFETDMENSKEIFLS